MPDPNISLDSDFVRSVVAKGLIEGLDAEQRNLILAQAVEFLLKRPRRNTYSNDTDPSPLEYAFQDVLREVAKDVVRDYIGSDGVRERVRQALVEALEPLIADKSVALNSIGWAAGEHFAEVLRGEHS